MAAKRRSSGASSYLSRQFNTWTMQMRVPADVQAAVGKKVIRESLKTADMHEARRLAQPRIDSWLSRFSEIRGQAESQVEMEARYAEVRRRLSEEGISDTVTTADELRSVVNAARGDAFWRVRLARSRISKIAPHADAGAAVVPIAVDAEQRLRRVQEIASLITGEAPPTPTPDLETLDTARDRWRRETSPAPSSAADADLAVRIFSDLFGPLPLTEITRQHAAQFREALLSYPTRVPAADRKLTARDLIAKYRGDESRRPDPGTAGKKLRLVRAIVNRAKKAGVIELDPFDGIEIEVVKKKKERLPFAAADLEKLFAALPAQPEEFQWIARLGYATGARLAEIAQLRAADLRVENGVTFISITNIDDEHGDRSTKTAASVRRVPLRAEIAPAFAAFAKGRRGLLFPTMSGEGRPGALASKRAARWIDGAGVTDSRLTFHSFRHLFADLCRGAGVGEEATKALLGHSDQSMTARYGSGVPLAVLAEAVARLRFPTSPGS